MDSAVELLLFKRIPAGAIGKMHPGHTRAVTGARGCRYDAPDGAREANLVEYRAHFLLNNFRVAQTVGMENVKIDDDVMLRLHLRDHWKQSSRGLFEPRVLGVRREQVDALPFMIVLSRCAALPVVHNHGAKVSELSNPVVPPGQRLQHQFAHGLVGGCEPAGDQAEQRLRKFDQRADSFVAIRGVGIGSQVGEVFLRLLVDLLTSPLKQRLVKVAIAHFPCQVGDRGKKPIGQGGHPVEELPKGFLKMRRQRLDAPQTSLEDGHNGRDLLLHALMRFVDPEQALFEFRGAVQCLDTIVSQGALECADKSLWESSTARLQHAQVRKQIGLGTGLFTAGPMVYPRLALEQGTYVHKDVEDLIFALSYFVAVRWAILAPFVEQPRGMLRIDVKAQHELVELIQALTAAGLDGFCVFVRGQRRAKDHALRVRNGIAAGDGVDLQEWGSGVHLNVGYGHNLSDSSGKWGYHLHLHFHGFEHSQAFPNRNRVARLDENGNHYRRRRRVHHAPVVSINPVRYTVHFDPVT